MFFSNGQHVETFMNHRTIELLSTFIENMVAAQSSPSENLPSPQTASTPAPPPASDGMDYDLEDQPGEVYMISAKTFDKYLAKGGLVFVKFYAPWCSHCREMEPAWQELARRLSDYKNVRIGKVDCTNNVELCMNQHVQAYPTLVLFKNGFKVEDYLTARDVDSMHSFIARHIKEHEEL
jgi:protein disulfide-isomerase-like protein